MKRILKIYLPILIFTAASGFFFLKYMLNTHLAISKFLAGEVGLEKQGEIIDTTVNVIIKEDGVLQKQIKVLKGKEKFYLVFEKTENRNFEVLIIDTNKKDILTTNSDCLEFLFSKYLIQPECGIGSYLSSEKNSGYKVKLESNDSQIKFQLPEYNHDKYNTLKLNRQIEIIFKGEQ